MSSFEMKREVTMHSSSHTQYTNGEPVVQVHGVASKTEQTSQKIGDEPAVKVSTPDLLKRTQNTLNAEFAPPNTRCDEIFIANFSVVLKSGQNVL